MARSESCSPAQLFDLVWPTDSHSNIAAHLPSIFWNSSDDKKNMSRMSVECLHNKAGEFREVLHLFYREMPLNTFACFERYH